MPDSDIPDQSLDGALPPELASDAASGSLKVVRHTFGGKAAAGVLIVMLAVAGALGQYLTSERDPFPQLPEPPKFQPNYNTAPEGAPPVSEADTAPAAKTPAQDPELEFDRAMDVSFFVA